MTSGYRRTRAGRRRVLQSVATVALASLAGCLGDGTGDAEAGEDVDTDGVDADDHSDDAGKDGDDADGENANEPNEPSENDQSQRFDERDPDSLETSAREFVELLVEGEFEQAHDWFTDEVATQLSVDELKAVWATEIGDSVETPTFHSVEYQGTEQGMGVVVAQAEFDDKSHQFTFAFAGEGLGGFYILPVAEWTPPPYADETVFSEEELTLDAPGNCSLGATLTLPDGDDTVPGVVLVHGSGPVDRDTTIGPNRTFRDLAWGLATRGIGVLRYDKRTFACDVDLADVTIDDVATDDALTAIEHLRAHDRIDADEMFVVGHSFGGTMAPRIADRDGHLTGIVALAPGGRPIDEMVVDQYRYLLALDGELTDEDEAVLAEIEETAERIRSLDVADGEVLLGLGGRQYYESLAEYDHVATAANRATPLLVAYGDRDYQTTVGDDLPVWRDALEGEPHVEFEVYEGLNHHFQHGEGPSAPTEYQDPDAFVAEQIISGVATFVEENT